MNRFLLVLLFSFLMINLIADVMINEIHYNPATSQGDDTDWEFLELFNNGETSIDLTGWTCGASDATPASLDGITISANGFVVIASNGTNYADLDCPVVDNGGYFGLGNSGKELVLIDADGVTIDTVTYSDSGDWPSEPDGSGPSLELISSDLDNSLPTSWQASYVDNGTPGAENSQPPAADPHTIYQIQFTTDESGESPYVNQRVHTSGIVTAVFDGKIFIQDGEGAWNGIVVETNADVDLGQNISFDGTVREQNGLTSINSISNLIVEGDETVPAPIELATGDVSQEMYEGVLVKITNVVVTDDSLGFGEWAVDDGSGNCIIDDYADYMYVPQNDDEIDAIQGVLTYTYGAFKIEPRGDEDFDFGNAEPEIEVISPNGGEMWVSGTVHNILWTSFNVVSDVMIYLVNDTEEIEISQTENDGTYEWNTNDIEIGSYKIRIVSIDDENIFDESDADFSIIEPVPVPDIVVNEIMYNSAGHDNEWIELFNNTSESVNLGGYKIYHADDDNAIVIPEGYTIDAGSYFTIQIDHAAQADPFPFTPDFDGTGVFHLLNSTDAIIVKDMYDTLVDEVYFADSGDWDSGADGGENSFSLELIHPNLDNNLASSWLASTVSGGTPGAQNSVYNVENDSDVIDAPVINLSNYPNPFNPTTNIRFSVVHSGMIELDVYNLLGQKIKTLLHENLPEGEHQVTWNGDDEKGNAVSSGIYFYKMKNGRYTSTKKMILLK